MQVPTYPGLRIALPNGGEIARRIETASPEAIHIATEGPIGWWTRRYCLRHGLPFTTSYTTRFPEYVSVRTGIPVSWGYAVVRRFHNAGEITMVATNSLRRELEARGFTKLGPWTRGVDTHLFNPDEPAELDFPRPIFATVGRVAVEKNLEAFLSLDLPGTRIVIGDGPQRAELERRFPDAKFLGEKTGKDLTSHIAAADVFVFPSLTDTWRGAARGAGLRHTGRRVPGHRSPRRHRRSSGRRAGSEPARRVPARVEHVARDVPGVCAGALLGEMRTAIHRQPGDVPADPRAASNAGTDRVQPGAWLRRSI
jgi:glycosyltransferase involved in cell wall biosynthesis